MRNVVLVTIDSLRADHCGFLGYSEETTSALDDLADSGVVYENAIAPGPSTYESMPAVFTGRAMRPYFSPSAEEEDGQLDARVKNVASNMHAETIPEWFDRHGYSTAGFSPNPFTGQRTAFSRGFDHYVDFMNTDSNSLVQRVSELPIASELENAVAMFRGYRASKPWQSYYDMIIDWVRTVDEPFFLWVFLMDPHTPYLISGDMSKYKHAEMYYRNWKLWASKKWGSLGARIPLNREGLMSLYDETIRSADRFVEKLREDLQPADPVIAVHADHGEAFEEHGIYGHRANLYEENVHVPFIVYTGRHSYTISDPVSLTSLPNVLVAAAQDRSRYQEVTSRYVFTRSFDPMKIGVRTREQKYIATFSDSQDTIVGEETYDISADPGEDVNLSGESSLTQVGRDLVWTRVNHDVETNSIWEAISGPLVGKGNL